MYQYIKRILDLFLIIVLFPFMLVIILVISSLILTYDGKPIFFFQERIGLNNKVFLMIKFRTLLRHCPPNVPSKEIDASLFTTKTGSFLRRTSLDEIPQIVNVLLGHMSFVGPRPLIKQQKELIEARTYLKIHKIKPGLTGLAQIYINDRFDDKNKIRFDYFYFKNSSFFLDMKIIYKTIIKLIKTIFI
jgi:O-antigen biosynthesis protein WbqP